MAEFCLECFNEFFDKDFKENEVTLEMDICEGCADIKPCVMAIYPESKIEKLFKDILRKRRTEKPD